MRNRQHKNEENLSVLSRFILLVLLSCTFIMVSFIKVTIDRRAEKIYHYKYSGHQYPHEKTRTDLLILDFDAFNELNLSYCDSFNIEIIRLYEPAELHSDFLKLDDDVKRKGFEQVYGGRGNWQNGYRFVEIQLQKDDCKCHIFKKFWDFEVVQDSSLITTEQIICNQEVKVNFSLESVF